MGKARRSRQAQGNRERTRVAARSQNHLAVKFTPAAPLIIPQGGAVVRMYCTGLGDCFLIGLPGRAGATSYVLIDCGVWKGTPGAREWMTRIMEHIRDTVGTSGIDVLVATHQHWDHLSGFAQARRVFEQIPIKEVWLPWTEDDNDPVALRLANERRLAIRAALAATVRLHGLAENAKAAGNEAEDQHIRAAAQRVDQVLKFFGRTPPDDEAARTEDALLVAAGLRRTGAARAAVPGMMGALEAVETDLALGELAAGPTTEDLLNLVRNRVTKPRYLRPSTKPIRNTLFSGIQIYALGPPLDPKLLGKDDPSTVPGKSEVYLVPGLTGMFPLNEDAALHAAAYVPRPGEVGQAEHAKRLDLLFPFERFHRISCSATSSDSEHADFFSQRYSAGVHDWRRIDTDWLAAAEQLALNLDHHVNNTSLVLAFELGDGDEAPVLLFPGDAQVGNWLSWHQLDSDGGFARSLLSRTVLYKVGHHASHNATLKEKGLALMTNKARLVAMIPVDQDEAHKPKGSKTEGWDMPYGKLLDELLERTEGRVLRADKGAPLLKKRPLDWSERKWKQFVEDTVVEDREITLGNRKVTRPFFIQYVVRP